MDLLIKNGTIVTAKESYISDIAVKNGKIVCIGTNLSMNSAKTVDATGMLVLPGAIDAHTHLAMPFGGTVSADGYLSGTRAAACGGVTTVFDYPMQRKGRGIIETVEERKTLCDPEACVDYAFHCIITDLNNGAVLDEFADSVSYGVTS
ncbi:MAG TPA: amidohydrolase family protein, partial [Ruminiclostridium sp.]|nr:amidohydrolase family protein [Ruminiclostridium sp.]